MSPPSLNSSTGTPLWTEELLRKLLLAKDINDVHFHVFSRRSKSRVLGPCVLNANTTLLKSSSEYFADLFSSDMIPASTAMMKITTTDEIFDGIDLSEYGYESDSDLEDDTEDIVSPTQIQVRTGSGSDDKDSGTCVPTMLNVEEDDEFLQRNVANSTGLSSEGPASIQPNGMLPPLGGGHHIFVKDAAFQTWYCLLHFLYMGTTEFSPLRSSGAHGSRTFSCSTRRVPKCSARSMYRLATKLNIEELRDLAFDSICNNIDECNLLRELASGFTGRYPAVLEMELDLLVQKIASAPIVEGLPKLLTRISQNELSHGANIMTGFYMRILQKHNLSRLPDPTPAAHPVPEEVVRDGSLGRGHRLAPQLSESLQLKGKNDSNKAVAS
ncbi:hypothetical protein BKA82DRAFT_4193150 [Pisolithus tinctorius]|nr:hypothetical protein BKA82DRAFT_4193150 [Pisolithus tinctorius]